MERAEVHVLDGPGAPISPFIFGALTEHFGRGLYGGIWDQGRASPRADVLNAARALGTTMFRYPGGCFSDWYRWKDGIGPRDQRPTHERQYWTDFDFFGQLGEDITRQHGPVETNEFGTDEFLQYCLDAGAEPMLVANFGSGSAEEAAAWVEYTNRSGAAPRPVHWWSVGNETYGEWEIGHCSPQDYGRGFAEYATAMKRVDPSIRIVAVGQTQRPGHAPTSWNRQVLAETAEHVDALSVHWYFPGPWLGRDLRDDEGDYLQLATAPDELGRSLDATIADIDTVTSRPVPLSLDEWNLWGALGDLLETNRRLCDSVFFAGVYNRILERADRVQVAMISHLVNCMAPIQTRGDRHFVTSSFLVERLYHATMRDRTAPVEVSAPDLTAPPFTDTMPLDATLTDALVNETRTVPALDASATRDATGTTVYLTNRHLDRELEVTVTGLDPGAAANFRSIRGPGPWSRNDVDHPTVLGYQRVPTAVDRSGTARVSVPPHTPGALVVG